LDVSDPDGELRRPDGPLWTCGQRLWLRLGFAGSVAAPLPPLVLTDGGETAPVWARRRQRWLRSHPTAQVRGADLTRIVNGGDLSLAGPVGGTMMRESARLLGLAKVDVPLSNSWPVGQDAPTPVNGAWPNSPLTALADLWTGIGCAVWVNRLGALEPRPLEAAQAVAAVIEASEVFTLTLGGGSRPVNTVVATGTREDGSAIVGRAETSVGPFRADGPYGTVSRRVSDSAAKTIWDLTRVAQTELWRETLALSRLVTARAHPAALLPVDPLDQVTLLDPAGRSWTGQVVGLKHDAGSSSEVTIRVPWEDRPW
jgi:hypothetical protein